jgi:hypothetical protein
VATDVLPALQVGVIPAEPVLSQPIEDRFSDNEATVLPNREKLFSVINVSYADMFKFFNYASDELKLQHNMAE